MDYINKKDIQLFVKSFSPNMDKYGFLEDTYIYFKNKKLIVENFKTQHNDFWKDLIEEYKKCSKQKVVRLFLNSLATQDTYYRVAISAYAIMTHYENHSYQSEKSFSKENYNYLIDGGCEVCGVPYVFTISPTVHNYMFFNGYNTDSMAGILCYLRNINKIEVPELQKEGVTVFSDIMNCIKMADLKDTPNEIQKKLKVLERFKSKETERRELLDTLGYLSILETKEHKGFLSNYNKLGHTPRKTKNSNWAYPIDFWTGKDGINKKAFEFWFGEYKDFESFWK